jgi:hypothetical protein
MLRRFIELPSIALDISVLVNTAVWEGGRKLYSQEFGGHGSTSVPMGKQILSMHQFGKAGGYHCRQGDGRLQLVATSRRLDWSGQPRLMKNDETERLDDLT